MELPPKTVLKTRAQLAKALGLSISRVDQLIAQGMYGMAGYWIVEDCKNWIRDHVRQHGGNRGRRQGAVVQPRIDGGSDPLWGAYQMHKVYFRIFGKLVRLLKGHVNKQVHSMLTACHEELRFEANVLGGFSDEADRDSHRFPKDPDEDEAGTDD
jgi:hypothetical protein